ncbi:hypothetical protein VNI00_017567 [Paramarasmius palmivorus]|uniref:Uncharacterized protein n=1 Tax=Paramarasmius palmivorus TaxID=297713 RepID=A0AAW0B4X6_9AGAR
MSWPAFVPSPRTDEKVTELHRAILEEGEFKILCLGLYLGVDCALPRRVAVPQSMGSSTAEWWNLHADFWVTSRFGKGAICIVEMVNDHQKELFGGQYTAFYYPNASPPFLDRLVDLNVAWLIWNKDIGSSSHHLLGSGLEDCRLLGPLLVVKHDTKGRFVDIPKEDIDMVLNLVKSSLMRRNAITGKRALDGFEGRPFTNRWHAERDFNASSFLKEGSDPETPQKEHGSSHLEEKNLSQGEEPFGVGANLDFRGCKIWPYVCYPGRKVCLADAIDHAWRRYLKIPHHPPDFLPAVIVQYPKTPAVLEGEESLAGRVKAYRKLKNCPDEQGSLRSLM